MEVSNSIVDDAPCKQCSHAVVCAETDIACRTYVVWVRGDTKELTKLLREVDHRDRGPTKAQYLRLMKG